MKSILFHFIFLFSITLAFSQQTEEDKLKEIFYPMVTTKNDGMGLGLTIAQSIIIQNNGVIECKSKNKETVFSIILPWSDNEKI